MPGPTAPDPAARELDPLEILARSPNLGPLSEAHRRALATITTLRRFAQNEVIVRQDEEVKAFHLVAAGRVKVVRAMPNGRQVVLSLFGPGQLFSAVDVIGRQPSRGTAIALTDPLVCLAIPRAPLFELLEQRGDMAVRLLEALTPHLAECKNCIVELACLRIEARLARILLRLAAHVGERRDGGAFLPIVLSRQDLADMSGTTLETTIRIMSRWNKEGPVETCADGFFLRDVATLRELSVS